MNNRSKVSLIKGKRFNKIYQRYLENLYNTALRLTLNQIDAEDLVEDTFIRAFRFFNKFTEGTNIKAWLFKIMHNLFINNYKKKNREPDIIELKEEILYKEDISEKIYSKFVDTEIQEALDSLPEEFREAIILTDLEDFSYYEIGEILDCPIGTVRSRISRGRKLLFNKLYNYAVAHGYFK